MNINSNIFRFNLNSLSKNLKNEKRYNYGNLAPLKADTFSFTGQTKNDSSINLDWVDDRKVKNIIKKIMKKTVKPTISKQELKSILGYFGYFETNRNNGHGQIWEPEAYQNKGIYFTVPTTDKAADDSAVEHLKEAFSIINDTNGELIDQPKNKHKLTPEEIKEFIESTKDYNPNGKNQYRRHFEEDKKK